MDYAKIASQVIANVGGKENIKSVAHCATRLRFQLKNNDLRNEEAISDLDGVKGVFLTQSQFQIIFGSGLVNLICDEVQKQIGDVSSAAGEEEKEEKQGSVVQRFVKMLSDIFVPIIPAIVAGGLLMGLNNILTAGLFDGRSIIELYPQWKGLTQAVNTFANAPFTFLPVLIGFSATKKFGGNPFLGAAMGMIMVHPDLLNAYQIGIGQAPVWDIFGFNIQAIGYQGTVLPVLAISWILAQIEKRLHKVTPTWLDNLTTPLLSIIITDNCIFNIHLCGTGIKRSRQLISRRHHMGLQYSRRCGRRTLWPCIHTDHDDRASPQLYCHRNSASGRKGSDRRKLHLYNGKYEQCCTGSGSFSSPLPHKRPETEVYLFCIRSLRIIGNYGAGDVWRDTEIEISFLRGDHWFRSGKCIRSSYQNTGTGIGSSGTSRIYLHETGSFSSLWNRIDPLHGDFSGAHRCVLEKVQPWRK